MEESPVAEKPPVVLPPELEKHREEYADFYENLQDEQKARRTLDFKRVEDLKNYLLELQQKLKAEGEQRRFVDACLDKLMQTRLDIVQQHLVHKFQTGLKKLDGELKAAQNRLGETERKMQVAQEKSRSDISALRLNLNQQLDAIQAEIRAASVRRKEEDEKTRKALEKEVRDIVDCAGGMTACRRDMLAIAGKRLDSLETPGSKKAGQIAIELLFARLEELRQVLALEKYERLEEEEKAALLLKDFAEKLQEGLRIVNKS